MRYVGIMVGLLAAWLLAGCGAPANEQATDDQTVRTILVYQSPTCGCCNNWVSYMEEQGYTVTVEFRGGQHTSSFSLLAHQAAVRRCSR